MQVLPQLLSKAHWIWKPPGCPEGITLPNRIMAFRPIGESDFISFENPSEEIVRIANLLPPVTYSGIANSDFNCHGAVFHILEGKSLEYVEFIKIQGEPIPLEAVEQTFVMPCGFQLWNGSRVIHSGIYLGNHNGKNYIYHKLGPQESEVSEINYGLYYYPNYTDIGFYGKKLKLRQSSFYSNPSTCSHPTVPSLD